MSHEMYEFDKMFSTGGVRNAPWHYGSGTNVLILDSDPATRMDRMVAAGHDWVVVKKRIAMVNDDLEPNRIEGDGFTVYEPLQDWQAVIRSDNGHVLNVAASSYEVVQNVVGHEVFEILTANARMDDGSGGTLKNGAICYLSCRIDEDQFVKGDTSPVYPYITVTWGHNGITGFSARSTNIRTVCWNTSTASELFAKRSGTDFSLRHTKNVMERIDEMKAVISGARRDQSAFVELANELGRLKATNRQREEFIEAFIPAPVGQVISDRVLDNILDARAKVRALFSGPTIPEEHRYSGYGMLCAGVEYLDHLRGYRNHDTYLGRTLLKDEPLKKKLVPMIRELVA